MTKATGTKKLSAQESTFAAKKQMSTEGTTTKAGKK